MSEEKQGVEQDLAITENGNYKNLFFKPNLKKGAKGLDNNNFAIIEKLFVEGYENSRKGKDGDDYKFYNCKAKYKDEEVSFLLYEKEHEQFKNAGGIGDKVKVTLTEETIVNSQTNIKSLIPKLTFEKVE